VTFHFLAILAYVPVTPGDYGFIVFVVVGYILQSFLAFCAYVWMKNHLRSHLTDG
jgi:hypothetical protein